MCNLILLNLNVNISMNVQKGILNSAKHQVFLIHEIFNSMSCHAKLLGFISATLMEVCEHLNRLNLQADAYHNL